MSEPLVLLIIVASAATTPAAGAPTEPMMVAVRRVLGPEATVIEETASATTDADALALGERRRARAVARVSWSDNVARLHVHVDPSLPAEWSEQEIAFAPQDAMTERGRTVGYALAAMVERLERERADEIARAAPASASVSSPALPASSPLSAASASAPHTSDRAPSRSESSANAFDVALQGIGALGGGASALGGALAVRWWAAPSLALRLAGGARAGAIADADATTTTWLASAGPAYRIMVGRAAFGARVDIILLRHAALREPWTRARWVGAFGLMLDAEWAFGSRVSAFVGAGPELAFGGTDIRVGGRLVADIPPVRGSAELGLRFHF